MNSKKILSSIFLMTIVSVIGTSCYYDNEDLLYGSNADCSTVDSKFSTAINPLMQSKCAYSGCHDAANAAGGVVLENYTQISASAGRIKVRCIDEKTMPPGSPLSASETLALQCWINAGTPNN
jgi:uncharacterized membrane protein